MLVWPNNGSSHRLSVNRIVHRFCGQGFQAKITAMRPCGKAALVRRSDEQAAKQDSHLGQLHQGTGGIACETAEPLEHAPSPDEQ